MFIFKRIYIFLMVCFVFTLSAFAQDGDKAIPLKSILLSIEKQHHVVFNYIDNEVNKIDEIITTIVNEIDMVAEYKDALIAEAVTGKIDVRDFEFPVTLKNESFEDDEEELSLATEEEVEFPNEEIEE
jgi:type I restriction enzyme S subunit